MGCGVSFHSRILTESSREKDLPLFCTYHAPGTVYPFILTASCGVGIISSFFTDEESKSQRLESCSRLVPEHLWESQGCAISLCHTGINSGSDVS